jgi:hypothetical protein
MDVAKSKILWQMRIQERRARIADLRYRERAFGEDHGAEIRILGTDLLAYELAVRHIDQDSAQAFDLEAYCVS